MVLPGAVKANLTEKRAESIVTSRTHVEQLPKYGASQAGDFRAGDTIQLEIPSSNWLDAEHTFLSFSVVVLTDNGDPIDNYWNYQTDPVTPTQDGRNQVPKTNQFARLGNGAQIVFNRVKLYQGSNVIEDIQDYNVLQRAITLATATKDWVDTIGLAKEGIFDPTDYDQKTYQRAVAGFNNGKIPQYAVTLNLGLLARSGKYIPMKWTGSMRIELTLEKDKVALVSSVVDLNTDNDPIGISTTMVQWPDYGFGDAPDGNSRPVINYNPTYRVRNVRLHLFFVTLRSEFEQEALTMLQDDPDALQINYDSFSTHGRQINGAGKTTLSFQERATSVKGGVAVMRNSADLEDYTTDMTFSSNGIKSYQWKVSDQYFPAQKVDCSGTATPLMEVIERFGQNNSHVKCGMLNADNFLPNHVAGPWEISVKKELQYESQLPNAFMMALNLERSYGQLSGFNTARAVADIELELELGELPYSKFRAIDGPGVRIDVDGVIVKQPLYNVGLPPALAFQLQPVVLGDNPIGRMFPKYTGPITDLTIEQRSAIVDGTYNANTFSRVSFFAHIDQKLSIKSVGFIEVSK